MKTIIATARAALDELEDLCIQQQDEIVGLKAKLAHKNDWVNPSIVGHDVIAKALLADHGSTPEQCLERAYQVWSKVIEDDSLSLNATRFHDLLFMEPRSHLWTDDIFFGEPSYVVKPGGFNVHVCAKCGWTGKDADDHKVCPPKPKEVPLEGITYKVDVPHYVMPLGLGINSPTIGFDYSLKPIVKPDENRGFRYSSVMDSIDISGRARADLPTPEVLLIHDSEVLQDGSLQIRFDARRANEYKKQRDELYKALQPLCETYIKTSVGGKTANEEFLARMKKAVSVLSKIKSIIESENKK